MLASVSLRLSSEGGVVVSSVLGTTHFVSVRGGRKQKKSGGKVVPPLFLSPRIQPEELSTIVVVVVVVFGDENQVWQSVHRKGAVKRDR